MQTRPEFGLSLVHTMAAQIAANRAPEAAPARARTIAVVPLDRAAAGVAIADELVLALRRLCLTDQLGPDPQRDEAAFARSSSERSL